MLFCTEDDTVPSHPVRAYTRPVLLVVVVDVISIQSVRPKFSSSTPPVGILPTPPQSLVASCSLRNCCVAPSSPVPIPLHNHLASWQSKPCAPPSPKGYVISCSSPRHSTHLSQGSQPKSFLTGTTPPGPTHLRPTHPCEVEAAAEAG